MTIQRMYQDTIAKITQVLSDPNLEPARKYGRITDLMLFSRVDHLRKVLIGQLGEAVVQSGPFQGMHFHAQATEGCYIPKLLGCYEAELHPLIEQLALENAYDQVVNIGCAEGYYAVGLACCLPRATVQAFDINPKAQDFCRELAALNQVADRVLVHGLLTVEDWPALVQGRTLIVSDCEGAEYELLDPERSGGVLRQADMLVELHQCDTHPERAEALLNQYRPTHEVEIIGHGGRNPSQFENLKGQKHLDQLLSVWEFRGGPTPWAFLRVKP